MRKYPFFIALMSALPFAHGMIQAGVDVGPDADVEVEEEPAVQVWVGPGWYYGFWFDNEYEYNDWHNNHWNNYHNNRPHNGPNNPPHHGPNGPNGPGGGGHRPPEGGGGRGGGGHGGGGHGR